jgi:glycosyltransferase involved in cell wall biosynthesis
MSGPPEISVVIPTHNRWSFLSSGSLPSALAQEGVDHEVIVVDDGSSDATAIGLGKLDHPRLRVIRHERSRGVATARNAGIAAARGDWVAFLDDDDLWSPHKLRRQLHVVQAARASFVYSDIVGLDKERNVCYELSGPEPDDLAVQLLSRYVIPGGASNVVAETELVRRLGGFDEQLFITADWDMWLRLAQTAKGARCPGVLVATTAHPGNMPSGSLWRELVRDLDHFYEKHREAGLSMDRAGFARFLALQRYRGGKRLDPALLLFWLSLRFRRPSHALSALGLLVPRPRHHSESAGTPPEPDWLAQYGPDRRAA